MMDLITALTLPDSIPYDGSLLVRAEYTRFRAGTSARWENEILKQSRRTCVIRCTGYRQEEAVHSLTASLLLRPVGTAESPAAFSVPENALSAGICWRSFSKEEIGEFSRTTGDTNSVHRRNPPVVQGLFLLKELSDAFPSSRISVSFLHPVYGGDPVFLAKNGCSLLGISRGVRCFHAEMVPPDSFPADGRPCEKR